MTKIIADISGNHGGDLQKALDLIKAAADCGCDYAKFQYYCAALMPDQENRKLYDELRVPRSWLEYLFMVADARQIPLFASVFDVGGVEELRKWRPPFFKIAAPESTRLTNYEKIVGAIPRATPIIFSTASSNHPFGAMIANSDILLWCHPGHPAKVANYKHGYSGLSDHCADLTNSILAIEGDAKWIERHIKLNDDCVDWEFSSNPEQMKRLCDLAHQSS
jgi:pseudaminic acid synthase